MCTHSRSCEVCVRPFFSRILGKAQVDKYCAARAYQLITLVAILAAFLIVFLTLDAHGLNQLFFIRHRLALDAHGLNQLFFFWHRLALNRRKGLAGDALGGAIGLLLVGIMGRAESQWATARRSRLLDNVGQLMSQQVVT